MKCLNKISFLIDKVHVNIRRTIFYRQEGLHLTQNDKERITVEIHNKSYTIIGNEPASHVRLVASLVDQKMNEIESMNKHLDTTKLAVLTAVNTMNDYLKLKEEYASLLGSLKKKED